MSRHTHESNLQHSVGEKILNLIFLHTRHTRKSEWNFKFSKFIPGRHIIMKIPARFRGELDTILILTIARGQQTHSTQWCSWHGGACLMWWLFLYFKTSKKKRVYVSLAEKWRWFIAYFNFIRGFLSSCGVVVCLAAFTLFVWQGGWKGVKHVNCCV